LGTIYELKFDKSRFKIGTLDQLMKLNDALGKVDSGLEALLRKIEKQGTDLNPDMELKIESLGMNKNEVDRDLYIQGF
jgi:hypothetical protein